MEEKRKKRNDLFLLGILVACSLLLCIGVKWYQKVSSHDGIVVVTIDGKEYGQYPLDKDMTLTIPSQGDNYNILEIKDETARVIEASCKDKICVKHAKISQNGETIICLPNKVVVTVLNGKEASVDITTN